ncbi:MAG: hypothetical protein KGZ83_03210 [Sulfuricella sp.]|nr:hypothetical protein [Sulfuricella sp.]
MTTLIVSGDLHGKSLFDRLAQPKALLKTDEPFDIDIRIDNSGSKAVLRQDDVTIDLEEIGNIYIRRPITNNRDSALPPHARDFINRETQEIIAFLSAYSRYKKSGFLFCQGKQFNLGSNKIIQLMAATELGIRIPETRITNIPSVAEQFYEAMNGEIIYKCLSTPVVEYEDGKRSMIHTSPVPNTDFSNVNNCPRLFQKNIKKATELRIAVVGSQTLAVSIDSQKSNSTRQDWRIGMSNKEMYSLSHLPQSVSKDLIHLHHSLGLGWGMTDMIVSHGGEHVFLETNPDGAWLWLEDAIPSLGITELLARYISKTK